MITLKSICSRIILLPSGSCTVLPLLSDLARCCKNSIMVAQNTYSSRIVIWKVWSMGLLDKCICANIESLKACGVFFVCLFFHLFCCPSTGSWPLKWPCKSNFPSSTDESIYMTVWGRSGYHYCQPFKLHCHMVSRTWTRHAMSHSSSFTTQWWQKKNCVTYFFAKNLLAEYMGHVGH